MRSAVIATVLSAAIASAIGVFGLSYSESAEAGYSRTSNTRYVSRTTRRIAVPSRNARVYNAPRGARLMPSRYWDPRTRWVVDPRTRTSYSVLSNGEVWFLEPSSGWAYTVDRYGRVYGCDPRQRSIYAFSNVSSWRGDLFYFFDFFTPWDGYYTVRDYDWFYSGYYGRRYSMYDYSYAYRRMWDDFDDYWYSPRFVRTIQFGYYHPSFIRYDSGYSYGYYSSIPSVYIAPIYSYTVVNNTVVVNNNYYNTYGNVRGGDNPQNINAQDAAVRLSQQIQPPTAFGGNVINAEQVQAAGFDVPVEAIKDVAPEPVASNEPAIEIPGLPPVEASTVESVSAPVDANPVSEPIATQTPVADSGEFTAPTEQEVPAPEPVVDTQPGFQDPSTQPVVTEQTDSALPASEPVYDDGAREQSVAEPRYEETQPVQERYEEPAYEEPAQEPVSEQPAYEEPRYEQEQPRYEEPAYEAPQQYEEPRNEEPAYEEPRYEQEQPRYEEPAYEAPQQQYEEPRYEEPAYEEPRYEQEQPRYEEPAYEAPQQQYEEPRYEEPRYEEPRYEAPQREEPRYEEPRYEAPQREEEPRYEAPEQESREEPNYEQPQ